MLSGEVEFQKGGPALGRFESGETWSGKQIKHHEIGGTVEILGPKKVGTLVAIQKGGLFSEGEEFTFFYSTEDTRDTTDETVVGMAHRDAPEITYPFEINCQFPDVAFQAS